MSFIDELRNKTRDFFERKKKEEEENLKRKMAAVSKETEDYWRAFKKAAISNADNGVAHAKIEVNKKDLLLDGSLAGGDCFVAKPKSHSALDFFVYSLERQRFKNIKITRERDYGVGSADYFYFLEAAWDLYSPSLE
jgi:hypothetical protein